MKLVEGYRSDFARLLCFFSATFVVFLLAKGKKKTENENKKTKGQQCGFERVIPTNARVSKTN